MSDHSALLAEKDQIIAHKSKVISTQKKRILLLEEALRLSKVKRFAPSSEQSLQTSLFDEAENEADAEEGEPDVELEQDVEAESSADEDNTETKPKPKKKTGRKPFSDSLPRKQIFIYLTDEQRRGSSSTFFTKTKEELDIIPAQVRVLEYMQEKAVFIEKTAEGDKRQIKVAHMQNTLSPEPWVALA